MKISILCGKICTSLSLVLSYAYAHMHQSTHADETYIHVFFGIVSYCFFGKKFSYMGFFREMDLLSMPSNTGTLPLVQWPLFLLSSKVRLCVFVNPLLSPSMLFYSSLMFYLA